MQNNSQSKIILHSFPHTYNSPKTLRVPPCDAAFHVTQGLVSENGT